jgi:two-component system, cell cycle sensor histidine kinase and response regulator CckA
MKQRILIVEDEPVQAMKLQFVLEQAGYEVHAANNGMAALTFLDTNPMDLVISDVMMPEMDGYTLCRKIRQSADLKKSLVVLLTSQADPSDVLSGLSVGADNFIMKPWDPKDLIIRVKQILAAASHRLRREEAEALEVSYRGKDYSIQANRLQMLSFFLTTYETQFRHSREVASARDELVLISENLEHVVEERTAALSGEMEERRRAEARIAEQAALLDLANDAIVVTGTNHEVVYWNKSAEKLYGWSAAEAVGRGVTALFMNDHDKATIDARSALLEEGRWTGEIDQVTKDGTPIVVQTSWTLVRDDQADPKSILMISTDITQKKKLEGQFLRAQRMESIGTLAGGIAHDLNNVLSPVLLSMAIFKEKMKDADSLKMLSMVEESARRGADMVKQVLMFARGVQGERMVLQPRHLVREMQKIVDQSFPKNITFEMNTPVQLPCVKGDATQLHQVLLNLCVNARDAMPHGGTLRLSAESVTLDEQYAALNPEAKPGSYILVRATDTGTGIPPEVIDKIFEPFFTTKEVGKGTGLGLSTVLAIVKGHEGFVRVRSQIGTGTSFEVYLPAVDVFDGAMGRTDDAPAQNGHGETVLVVDDERIVREITRLTLLSHGYNVLTADEGTEALALYSKHGSEISLVLTDIVMPYLDGASMIRALQRMDPEVRVIACSGLNSNEKRMGAMTLKDVPFIEKPYTTEALLRKIDEVLHGSMELAEIP